MAKRQSMTEYLFSIQRKIIQWAFWIFVPTLNKVKGFLFSALDMHLIIYKLNVSIEFFKATFMTNTNNSVYNIDCKYIILTVK